MRGLAPKILVMYLVNELDKEILYFHLGCKKQKQAISGFSICLLFVLYLVKGNCAILLMGFG